MIGYDRAALGHWGAGDGDPQPQNRKGGAADPLRDKGSQGAARGKQRRLDQAQNQKDQQPKIDNAAQNQPARQGAQPAGGSDRRGWGMGVLPQGHASRPLRRT